MTALLAIAAVATVAAVVPGTAPRPIVPPVHFDATGPGPVHGASGSHGRPHPHGGKGHGRTGHAGAGHRSGGAQAGTDSPTGGAGATGTSSTTPGPASPPPAAAPAAGSASARPAATVASTAPGPCAPWQVQVTTTTNAAAYGPGQPVTAASVLTQVAGPPCVLTLTGGAGVPCGVQLSFDDATGTRQYWPWPGQVLPCPATGAPVLATGDAETATQTWDQQAMSSGGGAVPAPPGTYSATGEWSWAGPGGQVVVRTARSAPFTLG